MVLFAKVYKVRIVFDDAISATASDKVCSGAPAVSGTVLVSYSYFQKDDIQQKNLEFFMAVGMGVSSGFSPPNHTEFVLVINGAVCDPCTTILPYMEVDSRYKNLPDIDMAWSSADVAVLQRRENEGMDFAAHNVTIEWLHWTGQWHKYRHFILLNSSVRGPFYPSYMGTSWQWTQAFTDRLVDDVKLVSSSLVCLPEVDAGGLGPKAESWAFAADAEALQLLAGAGVFSMRTCKLCDDGVVVMGEYGLSTVLLNAGHNIATLMSMYPVGTDWRDERHWRCNNNAHPSRHGTYDGISMHPFETVFLKASWHVGEPHLSHYTRWFLSHADGDPHTSGKFREAQYRYAIQLEAQDPNNASACFRLPAWEATI
ncbi:g10693 [Coccomyxa viridis]|uniref:G10693 protein n=1 Tax=Coccomyxa viridis TaxID=1274662 RepID=A0ABP1G8R7_9CHLO